MPAVALPPLPDLYEVIDGEPREVPGMGMLAATLATLLSVRLNEFAAPRRLGLAVTECLFELRPNAPQRRPDVAVISAAMATDLLGSDDDPPALIGPPLLAIEFISPTNTAIEMENKVREYFAAAVGAVWLIYPVARRAHLYDSATSMRIATAEDDLTAPTILPGFRVRLADLFAFMTPTTGAGES